MLESQILAESADDQLGIQKYYSFSRMNEINNDSTLSAKIKGYK
jgi:hypothetical protein